jgi:hypothetical protein
MISINSNNNVNRYWQTMASSTKPKVPAYGTYPPTQTPKPPIDMQSMFKLMFQMMKRYQSTQGQRFGKTQSVFSDSANPYSKKNPADCDKKFLSPAPVAKVPTPETANTDSTAFLLAMLFSNKQALEPKQTLPTKPVPPKPITKPPVEETLDLPIYTPPPPNEKVFIIGGYDAKTWNEKAKLTLGENIGDFNGTNVGEVDRHNTFLGSSWHNNVKTNDEVLKELFLKLSDEDKNLPMERGEGYIISESGKVLGKINSKQALNDNEKAYFKDGIYDITPQIQKNNQFKILEDLGVDSKDADNTAQAYMVNMQKAGSQEALGGKIQFDGKVYDVVSTVIRKVTPLTFDLNGDGVKTSNKMIKYDIDGDGTLDNINDVADGVLSIRGGASGHDVFGNNTDLDGDGKADGFKDGFEALKALAVKEGLIDGKQDMVLDASDLALLEKKYQLAMKTAGYLSKNESLKELGITEIKLGSSNDTKTAQNFDGLGNDLMSQEGSTFKLNGKTQDYADVWHLLK